jgi:type I restriction enzyme M protein
LRWSRFKDLDPENMFRLFNRQDGVFDFLRNIGNRSAAFSKYMKGATFMIPTPRLLSQVVDMLSNIDMADRDTKGDVYEYLLSKIASAGQNGQFRTPRHIIRMMVNMVQPTLDDVICDPSAGTCGFLTVAGEYLREHYEKELYLDAARQHFQQDMFMGMEFDPTMIRIGAMNLILHGIENPQLRDVDALSEANTAFSDQASLILANPPFKGSLDREAVDGKILERGGLQKDRTALPGAHPQRPETRRPRGRDRARRRAVRQQQRPPANPQGVDRPAATPGRRVSMPERRIQALRRG